MSTDDFSIRLKNIRDKYGCSQPKKNSIIVDTPKKPSEIHSTAMRPSSALKMNASYTMQEKELPMHRYGQHADRLDKYEVQGYEKKYAMDSYKEERIPTHKEHRLSFGNSSYRKETQNVYQPSRKHQQEDYRNSNLQKQIEKIRETYAADRKKLLATFESEYQHRKNDKISLHEPKNHLGLASKYEVRETFSREKNYGEGEIDSYKNRCEKINLLGDHSNKRFIEEEESSSPIKRMGNLSPYTQYKPQLGIDKFSENHLNSKEDTGRASSNYWRQKQARLSEMTSTKLNQLKLADQDGQWKKDLKKSGSRSMIKYQGTSFGSKHLGEESPARKTKHYQNNENISMFSKEYTNKNQYSVSNIDRIQQRIQSILGR